MTHPWLRFGSPVKRPSYITQGWAEARAAEVGGQHYGLDFRARTGDPIYAAGDGVVEFARVGSETAGNWIGIRHEGGLLTRYLHLSKLKVARGQRVQKGQIVGLAGSTGYSSGPHLHFDAIVPNKAALTIYEGLFGRPVGGYPLTDFGYKVPAEPLVPADGYSQERVVLPAVRLGIRLYADIPRRSLLSFSVGTIAAVAGLTGLAFSIVFFVRSRA